MIKQLLTKILNLSPPSPTPPSAPLMTEKASRIWGADDEFDYAKASGLLTQQGIPQPRKISDFAGYVHQYGNNIWVYAAVYQIAVAIASVPFIIYRKKYKSLTRTPVDEGHPLAVAFTHPNPYMTLYDLIEAIVANLELTGNCYLEEVRNKREMLKEIYPLQSHKVEIVPDKEDMIKGYLYHASKVTVPFDEDEITHIRYFNPSSDFYGMPPQRPGEVTILTENHAREWQRGFFLRSALPKGALETEQSLTDSLVKRLRTQWKAIHQGTAKSHEVAILEGGLKWRNIEINQRDMDFAKLRAMSRDEIVTGLFGVPIALLGFIENVNNSSLENLKKMFWENTLLPKMEKIESSINRNLIQPYDERVYGAFDKDSIEALKGSQETRSRIAAMLVDRGIMTINEARRKYWNMPDVAWGNTFYMPLNLIPVERAGEGFGTNDSGGEGRSRPAGRRIGRPPVQDENIKKGLLIEDSPIQTVDRITETVAQYSNEVEQSLQGKQIQSFDFNKTEFTLDEAHAWFTGKNYKTDDMVETENTYCFRQFLSDEDVEEIKLADGLSAFVLKEDFKSVETS